MKFLFFFVVAVNKLKKKINYNLSEKARDCKNNNKTSVMYLLFCIIIFSFFFVLMIKSKITMILDIVI